MSDLDTITDIVARERSYPQALALHVLADAFRLLTDADSDITADLLRQKLLAEVGHKGITFAKDLISD